MSNLQHLRFKFYMRVSLLIWFLAKMNRVYIIKELIQKEEISPILYKPGFLSFIHEAQINAPSAKIFLFKAL